MKVAFDLGFGWTKVCTSDGECFKFPSWIAYHSDTPVDNVEKVMVDGKYYVIGEDAKYEKQKITLAGINELINYFPVFKTYVFEKLGIEDRQAQVITGLPPIHRDKSEILEKQGVIVLPQGVGIYLDVKDDIDAGEMLIIDIGFNTIDYLIVRNDIKKKGNTFEKEGIEKLVERFRDRLPKNLGFLKSMSFQTLMDVFERGFAIVEGQKIDLTPYKEKAIEEYNETILTRLKSELGTFVEQVETVVVAGGGAYYLRDIRPYGVYIPEKPEFSQARGYLKA